MGFSTSYELHRNTNFYNKEFLIFNNDVIPYKCWGYHISLKTKKGGDTINNVIKNLRKQIGDIILLDYYVRDCMIEINIDGNYTIEKILEKIVKLAKRPETLHAKKHLGKNAIIKLSKEKTTQSKSRNMYIMRYYDPNKI